MAREAYSLQQLEVELQALYPGTTTWEVGDKDHQNSYSDHNLNKAGVYCAKDIFGNEGLNLRKFVDHLRANPHPNLRYIIHNYKIYKRSNGFKEEEYTGRANHATWVHVSVGNGPDGRSTSGYDSHATWNLKRMGTTTPPNPQQPNPTTNWTEKLMSELPELSEGSKGLPVNRVQALANIRGARLVEDGHFGGNTKREVKEFQRATGLKDDGVVGPKTWAKLLTWKW